MLDLETVSRSNIPAVAGQFAEVNGALVRNNPDGDFLLSLCIWGSANVRAWAKDVGNISRTSDDISPDWGRMLTNFDTAAKRALYAHPGTWNDPDMLFIGKGDFDDDHLTEARSHFALWAMINAPLLIGGDLRKTPQSLMDIFGNAALIALNQDPGGHQAVIAYDSDELQIFVKTLADGRRRSRCSTADQGHRGDADGLAPGVPRRCADRADRSVERRDTSFTRETKLMVEPRQTLVFRASGTRSWRRACICRNCRATLTPRLTASPSRSGPDHPSRDVAWEGTRGKGRALSMRAGAGRRPKHALWT